MHKRVPGLLLGLLLAAACGGGGGSASDDPRNPGPPASNTPPSIAGSPALEVMVDDRYDFTPTASDEDGDALSFRIVNAPVWASFDPETGALTGTPGAADVGTTSGIVISVEDGTDSASLAAFDLEVVARPAGSALVSWDIPTTNEDGSTLDDLAGFAVHYGQASASYSELATIDDDTATSAAIGGLAAGEWFFAVTAFDTSGNHSALSDEVSKVVTE